MRKIINNGDNPPSSAIGATVDSESTAAAKINANFEAALGGSDAIIAATMPKLTAALARQKATNGEQPARILVTGESSITAVGAGTNPNDHFYNTTDGRKNSWPVLLAAAKGWQDCSFFGDQNNSRSLVHAQTLDMNTYQNLPATDPRIAISGTSWKPCPTNKFGHPVDFTGSIANGSNVLTISSITNPSAVSPLVPNMEVFKSDGTSIGWLVLTSTGTGGTGTYNLSPTYTGTTLTNASLTANHGMAFAGRPIYAPANASGSLSFTPTQKITRFKLWYYQPAFSDNDENPASVTNRLAPTALVVKVDGSTVSTVDLNVETGATGGAYYDADWGGWLTANVFWVMKSRTFTIATAGIHTINLSLGNGSGSGNTNDLLLYGIEAWDHTNPNPIMLVTGWSGSRIYLHTTGLYPWAGICCYTALKPDYALISESGNDAINATPYLTYAKSLYVLVKNLAATADIGITPAYCAGQLSGFDAGHYISLALPYYNKYMKALAASFGGSFVENVQIFGVDQMLNDVETRNIEVNGYPTDGNGAVYPDGIISPNPATPTIVKYDRNHPNQWGHALWAKAVQQIFD